MELAKQVMRLSAGHQEVSTQGATTARRLADTNYHQARRLTRESAAQRRGALCEEILQLSEALAPGVLSAPWEDLTALRMSVGILDAASFVRAGTLFPQDSGSERSPLPLLLPLLDHGNILVRASGDDRAVDGIVQEVALRSLLGTGAGQLSLETYDPHLRGTNAAFTALRQVSDELVPPTRASSEDLRELLDSLSRDVRRISEMYEGLPTTLGEFRRSVRQPIERYRLVVLLNYPVGFDGGTHMQLRTLLRTGPACGVSLIVHHDITVPTPDGVSPDELYALASVVRTDPPATVDGMEGITIDAGVAPSLAVTEPAIEALKERAKEAAAPRINFRDLQPAQLWRESSAERLTAVIGMSGHQPIEITLGDEREQRHNVLVSGAVGQGKSNLLMALVHSWATRYAPDELDLYLLDFKDGVTLYPLAPHHSQESWLPHARVVGLESDRAFGAAVLTHLVNEFDRRAAVMRPYGDNIARFRQAKPDAHMPRIVLVIDEFHVLFEEDDETSRIALLNLERLARKGRAYGIHLVLASQTLSGITTMLAKQDGIFAQFPIRLALKNSAAESRCVLDRENAEAARLRYRGELIANTDFGQVDANRRGVVALADPVELARLREQMWRVANDPQPPMVFNGGVSADLSSALLGWNKSEHEEARAILGVPIAVTSDPLSVPLSPMSGRHISVVGSGQSADNHTHSIGASLLQASTVSLAYQHEPESARFVVVNLLAPNSGDQAIVDVLQRALNALGHNVELRGGDRLLETLSELAAEVNERSVTSGHQPTYLIVFGMDRAPSLRATDPVTFSQPIEALHTVWRDGSQRGIHLIAWWASARSHRDHVGIEADGATDVLALLRVSGQDVIDLLGPFASWAGPPNRVLVRDVTEATEPTVLVPFSALTDQDVVRLSEEHRS